MTTLATTRKFSDFFNFSFSENTQALLRWMLVWLILSNFSFMLLWAIGAPTRKPEILAAAVIGLVVRGRPFWLQYTAFCVALIYSVLAFIAGLFNLAISSLIYSLQFFGEINPVNSLEYLLAFAVLVGTAVAAFLALRKDTNFQGTGYVALMAVLTFGLCQIDKYMGQGMRGHYKRDAPVGAHFESASGQTEFFERANGERNLILIIVESLGVPRENPEMQRKLFAQYDTPAVNAMYDVSTGTSLYYNSTTSGEVRELCGRWGDYYDLVEQRDDSCAPAVIASAGYETTAFHSFDGDFFLRNQWYPNIGFENMHFSDELIARGARPCGGVFPGACDRDVPQLIAEQLRTAETPQFIYWLTVNAHLPVPPGANLDVDNCERVSPVLAAEFPMICRQYAIFDATDAAVIREITAADFPDSDILIVGDHMPPYFDRHHRSQFDPERVPYIYLQRRAASGASDTLAVAAP